MGFSQAPGMPYGKLGIPEDGDTASRAISKGKYVIWKGKNYFAKTDILQGETFVEDTNLTEIPDGALNGIADALNASLTGFINPSNIIKAFNNSLATFSSYTATEDCYFWFCFADIVSSGTHRVSIYLDSVLIAQSSVNAGNDTVISYPIPLKKGQTLSVSPTISARWSIIGMN